MKILIGALIAAVGCVPLVFSGICCSTNKHWPGIVFGLVSLLFFVAVAAVCNSYDSAENLGLSEDIVLYALAFLGSFGSSMWIFYNAKEIWDKRNKFLPHKGAHES